MDPIAVRISADATHELRRRVLRPHQSPAEMEYAHDRDADTRHFGCHVDGELVAIGSVYHEPRTTPNGWRVRGMGTAEGHRRQGYGRAVLDACLAHAADYEADEVWCNARSGARRFYEQAGFEVVGGEFELPGIGPHYVMALRENNL